MAIELTSLGQLRPGAVHVKFQPLRRGLSAFPARLNSSWEKRRVTRSDKRMCFRSVLHRRKEIFLVVLLFFLVHVMLDDSDLEESETNSVREKSRVSMIIFDLPQIA